MELKPCPFCGGNIDERGAECNYGKKIITLNLKCDKCETIFKFKSKWETNPIQEAIETWNRRIENEELLFTRQFIVDHGLTYELLNAWEGRANNG